MRNDQMGVNLNPGCSKPAKAWAPGLQPPGWNDQLLQPCLAYPPGQEPPEQVGPGGFPLPKPMIAVGPGQPDPWADLPPFATRPMIAFGPGEDNPYERLDPSIPRPMGDAGAGTGGPSTANCYLPGTEPGGGSYSPGNGFLPEGGWNQVAQ